MIIRIARPDDIPAILAIYNDAVLTSTAIWDESPATLEERTGWYREKLAKDFPIFAAEADGRLIGYSTFGDFRPHSGFRFCVEHSVYVAQEARRRGAGTLLLQALFHPARQRGKDTMIGGIAADNTASLRLHMANEFHQTGRMPDVGTKFGRRLDLVWMQKRL